MLAPVAQAELEQLVVDIMAGRPEGEAALYVLLSRATRAFIHRQMPEHSKDIANDTHIIVAAAIRAGEIREPVALLGFIRTVARRQLARRIGERMSERGADSNGVTPEPIAPSDPERDYAITEQAAIIRAALAKMRPIDREVMTRFYLDEQNQEQICAEMNLDFHRYKNLKCRAKAKLAKALLALAPRKAL